MLAVVSNVVVLSVVVLGTCGVTLVVSALRGRARFHFVVS